MTEGDLTTAQTLAREVGWPHRREDWQFVLALGRGLVAVDGSRIAGTAMWWPMGEHVTRVGMVIVDPGIQRGGLGRSLMEAVLERVATRTVQLNATRPGEPLYLTMGFIGTGSIDQHQGASFSAPLVPLRAGERIRPFGRGDISRLVELDAAAQGVPRDAMLAALLGQAETVVLDHAGETVGFACYRRFGRGHIVGPVVARDIDGAKALIAHWIGSNPGMFLRIDVPAAAGLSKWLDELGLAHAGTVVTMFRGTPPPPPAGTFSTFALVNQALG